MAWELGDYELQKYSDLKQKAWNMSVNQVWYGIDKKENELLVLIHATWKWANGKESSP
jgi:hypothetical protein